LQVCYVNFRTSASSHMFRVLSASSYDVDTTISNAHDVFKSGVWSKTPAIHRSMVLSNIARRLEEKISDLAALESMQTGRAIREMKAQLGRLPEWL
jgi:acyl-CoA reductase-like NAD-dependent aldehyde dehydrogenase